MSKTFEQLLVPQTSFRLFSSQREINTKYGLFESRKNVAAALLEIEEHKRMFWKFLVEFPEAVNYWISKLEAKCFMLNTLCFSKNKFVSSKIPLANVLFFCNREI